MTWSDNKSTSEKLHRSSSRSEGPSDLKGVFRRPTENKSPEYYAERRQQGLQKSHFRLDGPSDLNGVLRRQGGSDSQNQYAQTRPYEQHLELLHMLTDDALSSPDDSSIALKQITNHLEATETKQKLGEIIAQNCRETAGFIGNRIYTVHQPPALDDHHEIAEKLQKRYEEAAAKQMSLLPNIKTTSEYIDDQKFAAERVRQASIKDIARNDLKPHPINKIPEQFEDDSRNAAERVRDATLDVERNDLRPPQINKIPAQFEDDRSFAAERVRKASSVLERNDFRQPPVNKIPAQFEDDRSLAAERVRKASLFLERNDLRSPQIYKIPAQFEDDRSLAAERVRNARLVAECNNLRPPPINKIPAQFKDDRKNAAETVRAASLVVERNDLRPPPINKIPAQFEDERSCAAERVRNACLVVERNDLRPPPINKIPAQFEDDRSFAARRVRFEYAAEVRFFEKHDYGVTKEFEAGESQIVDELAKEEAVVRRNELSREAELDRKRQELLEKKAKKQRRTKNKKSKKNERLEHIGSTAVDVVNATETTVKATEGAIPAPPSSVKPHTVSFNAQRRMVCKVEEVTTAATGRRHFAPAPAPPCADKPREACYGAVNKNMVFYDPERKGFVPAPPKTEKPKEGSFDRIRRIKAEVERKSSGEVEDTDKGGDGERNKNQTKIRKGSDGLSYLIDINTFRPSTSNRKLERAHAQVVSGQVAPSRHGEPVVMTWNATTAKRGVGFRSKLRKYGDKSVGALKKDGDGG